MAKRVLILHVWPFNFTIVLQFNNKILIVIYTKIL